MLNSHYYNSLTYQEQQAYDSMRSAIQNRQVSCRLGLNNLASLEKTWKAVVFENPEFIHYHGLIMCGSTTQAEFYYPEEITEGKIGGINQALFYEEYNRLVEKINASIPEAADDYGVCKCIYDAVCTDIAYDHAVLRAYYDLDRNNQEELRGFLIEHCESFTAYGALLNKKGVCQAVSKLFNMLCDSFGIQCLCVEAQTNDGNKTGHMLNVVEIDEKRYFVDVTTGLSSPEMPMVLYNYFMVDKQTISVPYIIMGEFECDHKDKSYFKNHKTAFRSLSELKRYLSSYIYSSTKGQIRCQYIGGGISDDDLRDIFEQVVSDKCTVGYRLCASAVLHGFISGLIVNSRED